MLERVEISNFRCLRSVDVPLRPLTVLIGANDSGKSAFLAALGRLAAGTGFQPTDWWRFDQELPLQIRGTGQNNAKFQLVPKQALAVSPSSARNQLTPVGMFDLPSSGPAMQSPGYADHTGPPELGVQGEMTAALFDYLLRRHRQGFFALVEALRNLVPGLEELEIATPNPTLRRIELVIENGLRLPASLASSGVRLLIFFIGLAYHPQPPRLLLVEEPEKGVHPGRLGDVMRLLREITQGKHGDHAAQVVLTTHSPHLLDSVDLETDQVLVFRREDDGSRSAEPVDAERLKNFLDEFMLGEVWYNEGEAGLVAPKP